MNMILMKIDANGELEADWEEIERLTQCFDNGCKSEEAYRAKLFTLVLAHGYDAALEEVETHNRQMIFMLSMTGGNA